MRHSSPSCSSRWCRQVPVGGVPARLAQHLDAVEEGGREVHPLLVDEEAALDRVQALAVEAAVPPVEEGEGALVEGDAEEAEVVDAGEQEVALARRAVVVDRRADVRRHHHVGCCSRA